MNIEKHRWKVYLLLNELFVYLIIQFKNYFTIIFYHYNITNNSTK